MSKSSLEPLHHAKLDGLSTTTLDNAYGINTPVIVRISIIIDLTVDQAEFRARWQGVEQTK